MHWHLQLLLLQWSGKGSALLLQRYLFTLLGLLLLYDGVLENILFIYLFIYLFILLLLLLLFADWNNYNYNSNIFSVKYQGRWKILCYCIIMLTFQWCCYCIHSWQIKCVTSRNYPHSLHNQFLVWTFQSSKKFLVGFILKNIICTSSFLNATSFSRCK